MIIEINNYINTCTFYHKNISSISYIENLISGFHYVLKGKISDLWTLIVQKRDIREIYNFAFENNIKIEGFLYELFLKGIIKNTINVLSCNTNYLIFEINEKDKIFPYFLEKKERFLLSNNFIELLYLELTYMCNLKCKHCFNPKNMNNYAITFKQAKKIIDEAFSIGLNYVTVTGGECSINMDFLKIIKYIRQKYLPLKIITNAQMLYDNDNLLKEIITLFPSMVQISLYSLNPKIHDKITGVKNSQKKTISVIKKLRENNIKVTISCLQLAINFGNYKEVKKFAESVGASFKTDYFYLNNTKNNNLCYKISEKDIQTFIDDTFDKKNIRKSFIKNDKLICQAGSSIYSITPKLDITPCLYFNYCLGNYNSISLKQVRSTIIPKFKQYFIRNNLSECFKQPYCKYCAYCPSDVMFDSKFLGKSLSFCEESKAYYNAILHHQNKKDFQ